MKEPAVRVTIEINDGDPTYGASCYTNDGVTLDDVLDTFLMALSGAGFNEVKEITAITKDRDIITAEK